MNHLRSYIALIFVFLISACATDSAVAEISVKSISVSGNDVLVLGTTQLIASVLPENTTKKSVTWSVSNATIASISNTGLLTASDIPGTVKVTATADDGSGITGTKTITVMAKTEVRVLKILVSGDNITDGQPKQFIANVLPVEAINKTVVWAVSNPAIATISTTGLLTPSSNGIITVSATATDGSGQVGELQVTISGFAISYATTVRAESILIWQRNNGGWGKAVPDLNSYNKEQTPSEKAAALASKGSTDTTIDNGHICTELRWFLADYKTTKNPNYLTAAEKAIDLLLQAQYANGGWPQYYPDKSLYRHQITYNDGAMANVMNVMYDIYKKQNNLEAVNSKYLAMANAAFNKGIECILKTQIVYNGKKTVWCAQHEELLCYQH